MKKIFTLIAAAMLSVGAFAQEAIGLNRPIDLENGVLGDVEVKAPFGVTVTPIVGDNTKTREEQEVEGAATDLYIGYSLTEAPEANKAAFALVGENVFYPKVAEQSARQADEFFGFHLSVPAGKPISVSALDVYLLSGNAYMWQVEITDAEGAVIYKTQDKGIKINNYNKTAYTNAIKVTADAVTEPEWSNALYTTWGVEPNNSVSATDPLPADLKLEGEYDVKVYYWGKWQKNLSYANIYLYATGEEEGGAEAGLVRPIDLENGVLRAVEIKEALGVKVTEIRGADTKTREEQEVEGAATDLYIGYSLTEAPESNKAAFALTGENVFYPKVAEQSARQAEEYFGYKMEIPEGKTVNIDALDVYLLSGNAYQWQVEITNEAGDVLYKTQDKGIKINNYNKTAYTNAVKVTKDKVIEPDWTVALLKSWGQPETYDVADTTPLTGAVNNLTGNVYVKVYYWGKWQKNLSFANILTTLSEGTTGITNATVATPSQKVVKAIKDGKLVIVKGANTYNVAGQIVK